MYDGEVWLVVSSSHLVWPAHIVIESAWRSSWLMDRRRAIAIGNCFSICGFRSRPRQTCPFARATSHKLTHKKKHHSSLLMQSKRLQWSHVILKKLLCHWNASSCVEDPSFIQVHGLPQSIGLPTSSPLRSFAASHGRQEAHALSVAQVGMFPCIALVWRSWWDIGDRADNMLSRHPSKRQPSLNAVDLLVHGLGSHRFCKVSEHCSLFLLALQTSKNHSSLAPVGTAHLHIL